MEDNVCFHNEKSAEKSSWAGDFRHESIFNSDVLTVGVILTIFSA